MSKLSVAIIMDGNRRWAKAKGFPTLAGHEEGTKRVRDIAEWAIAQSVSHLFLYAFSTENWKRNEEEVGYLMKLLERAFTERIKDIEELNVRIRIIGERERFSTSFQEKMREIEERSKNNTALTLVFCLSYGARADIAQAATRLSREGKQVVTEEDIAHSLSTAGMPEPDILIRPGGEKRLSNFLLFESAYTELFFTDTLWPDFTEDEFSRIVLEYRGRERRRGA